VVSPGSQFCAEDTGGRGTGQWSLAVLVFLVEMGYSRSICHPRKHGKQYYIHICSVEYLGVNFCYCGVFIAIHCVLFPHCPDHTKLRPLSSPPDAHTTFTIRSLLSVIV
jgi:hypothetical protein